MTLCFSNLLLTLICQPRAPVVPAAAALAFHLLVTVSWMLPSSTLCRRLQLRTLPDPLIVEKSGAPWQKQESHTF